MRMYEIANAEDQLGLLRVIMNNTWSAISQQASAQAKQKVAQASKPKAKAPKAPKIPKPKVAQLSQRTMPAPVAQQTKPVRQVVAKPVAQAKMIAPSQPKSPATTAPTITTKSPQDLKMFRDYLRGETPKPL
ncbi:hypothetical protein [Polynucleobacter sp. MWH-Aus1W21]|uniref:hypothetical protein n=1 Tax=Polynucleobacter sp. MWH-Aus1W21 TaxID=1855880 RepID=UPI001BFECC67|nr:hypothetical protein [Polynucleobacter sp. MWH-Aus1W21]QWD66024.1 hypothetical protein ICW03_10320 [Polynucleobacter sp. MWH-Aus1W21]